MGSLLDLNAFLPSDDADVHHVEEETMINNSLEVQDGLAGSLTILDGVLQQSMKRERG